LAAALGRSARLFAAPPAVFAALRRMPRLGPLAEMTLSLQLDDARTRTLARLGASGATETALAATVQAFRSER